MSAPPLLEGDFSINTYKFRRGTFDEGPLTLSWLSEQPRWWSLSIPTYLRSEPYHTMRYVLLCVKIIPGRGCTRIRTGLVIYCWTKRIAVLGGPINSLCLTYTRLAILMDTLFSGTPPSEIWFTTLGMLVLDKLEFPSRSFTDMWLRHLQWPAFHPVHELEYL